MSLIGILFICIIGVYVWTFKVYKDCTKGLSELYDVINKHLQAHDIHGDSAGFVPIVVCKALHTALKDDVVEIKSDIKKLLSNYRED